MKKDKIVSLNDVKLLEPQRPESEFIFRVDNMGCRAAFNSKQECYFETEEQARNAIEDMKRNISWRKPPYYIQKIRNTPGQKPYNETPVQTITIY